MLLLRVIGNVKVVKMIRLFEKCFKIFRLFKRYLGREGIKFFFGIDGNKII